jgi:PTS system mannitol-specific IIC component
MGSSAMGAGVLRKKVQDAGLSNISVTNSAINNLPWRWNPSRRRKRR